MWYVVQVMGGKEESTCNLINRMVSPSILDECFTPRYELQKKIRGTFKTCTSPLFPGYVIAVTNHIDELRRALRDVPEFTKVLTAGETFAPLDEHDRALICTFTQKDDRTVKMSMAVMEGDHVVVTSGPLVQREGWIKSIDRRRGIAYLEFQMFGRTMSTRVGLGIVAKRPKTTK